jgi:non-specific serine/threonine protein kinase
MSLDPRTRLGAFEILERIGAGGMGEVYRARDTELRRDVAIKVLLDANAADTRQRLLREARAAAGLNHPSICTIHEVGEADGLAYIAMEFVDGRPLSRLIAERSLSSDEVRRLALALADGLAHAQRRGIVHGDLKPANVIVTAGGHVKLLDFGLARRLSPDGPTVTWDSLGAPGVVAGTLGYMAPEQLRGAPADARSDVWALGTILSEMTPDRADARLQPIIARCLERDPLRRYANADEVRIALEALESTAPARARSRTPLFAASVALAAFVGLVVWQWRVLRAPRLESIAVLPFANAGGEARHQYVADTVADQLGVDLGNVGALTVVAGQATKRYKATEQSPIEIGRELGTAALVQGSTLISGDRVRVTVRLIETSSQRQLWAQTYDDDISDVLRTSKSIVRAIVREIRPALTGDQQRRIERAPPAVEPAVLELLRAGRVMDSRSVADYHHRRTFLEQAVAQAPDYAPAHLELAVWFRAGINQNLIGTPADAYVQMRRELSAALKLDPDLADAHTLWGDLATMADWDWKTASTETARGVELNPSSELVYHGVQYHDTLIGKYDEALIAIKRWHALFPTNPNYFGPLAFLLLAMRDYDGLGRELERAGITDVNQGTHRLALNWQAVADVLQGRADRATKMCDALLARAAGETRVASNCGFVFGRAGHTARAEAILKDLVDRRAKGEYIDPFLTAAVYAGLNRRDDVFAALNGAADEHSSLIVELATAPWLDAFHGDERYQALFRRIGFPGR